jgi:hypothetical protein
MEFQMQLDVKRKHDWREKVRFVHVLVERLEIIWEVSNGFEKCLVALGGKIVQLW